MSNKEPKTASIDPSIINAGAYIEHQLSSLVPPDTDIALNLITSTHLANSAMGVKFWSSVARRSGALFGNSVSRNGSIILLAEMFLEKVQEPGYVTDKLAKLRRLVAERLPFQESGVLILVVSKNFSGKADSKISSMISEIEEAGYSALDICANYPENHSPYGNVMELPDSGAGPSDTMTLHHLISIQPSLVIENPEESNRISFSLNVSDIDANDVPEEPAEVETAEHSETEHSPETSENEAPESDEVKAENPALEAQLEILKTKDSSLPAKDFILWPSATQAFVGYLEADGVGTVHSIPLSEDELPNFIAGDNGCSPLFRVGGNLFSLTGNMEFNLFDEVNYPANVLDGSIVDEFLSHIQAELARTPSAIPESAERFLESLIE